MSRFWLNITVIKKILKPITLAAYSKARKVFSRLNTMIVGSNPTRSTETVVFLLSCDRLITHPWNPNNFYKILNSEQEQARESHHERKMTSNANEHGKEKYCFT
jgi:hypothetical protein